MASSLVSVQKMERLRVIRLQRTDKLNALSTTMLSEVLEALDDADRSDETRGVVLAGDSGVFSVGADLNEALAVSRPIETMRWLQLHRRVNTTIEALCKPVAAVIEGYCYTGGLELALACDYRVGEEGSKYAITSSRIGSVAGMGGTQRLPRLIGRSAAKDMLMSARIVSAEEAHEIGLIDRLTPASGGMQVAIEWLEECASRAPLSVALAKWAVNRGMNVDLESALDFESLLVMLAFGSADRLEGMNSALQKRDPTFGGQ